MVDFSPPVVARDSNLRPPDFQVVGEGAGADLAEAVGFGEMFDGDDGRHEGIYN